MFKWLMMICTILCAGKIHPTYKYLWIDINLTDNPSNLKELLASNDDIKKAIRELRNCFEDFKESPTDIESEEPANGEIFLFEPENDEETVYIGRIKNKKFAWVYAPYYPLEARYTTKNPSLEKDLIKHRDDQTLIFVTYIPKGEGYVQQVTSVKQFLANPPKSLASDKYYGFVFTKSDSAPILAELSNNGSIRFFGRNFDEYIARTKELITVAEGNYQEFKKALDNNIVWVRAHA